VPWTDVPPNRPLVFDVFADALQGTGPAEFITPARSSDGVRRSERDERRRQGTALVELALQK